MSTMRRIFSELETRSFWILDFGTRWLLKNQGSGHGDRGNLLDLDQGHEGEGKEEGKEEGEEEGREDGRDCEPFESCV